jgi:hypothetical protein
MKKNHHFYTFRNPYGFGNGRFLIVSIRSPPSITTDEQLCATRKILTLFLISQSANDSDKKYDFFQFFKNPNYSTVGFKIFSRVQGYRVHHVEQYICWDEH